MFNELENIIEIKGGKEGGTSIILAGVHGNEKPGIEALREIAASLAIEYGTVLIGYGNPRAIEANVRFTEANLNRMFKPDDMLTEKEKSSYEYARAQFLKTCLNKADVLLDVHLSSNPQSKPFVICEINRGDMVKGIVSHLPIDTVVSGFDMVEPGGTDYYMNSIGKTGICIECGYLGDSEASAIAKQAIQNFLVARGHISHGAEAGESNQPKSQNHIAMYNLYTTKTSHFVLAKNFADFEDIESGQLIGTDGDEEVRAEKDSIILFAKNKDEIGGEAFLLGERI